MSKSRKRAAKSPESEPPSRARGRGEWDAVKKIILLAFVVLTTTGCPEAEIAACKSMCAPSRVLKFEGGSCYCDITKPAGGEGGR